MLFYTTFARRTFTVSLNELFENYTGHHTHVYSVRMSRLKYPPCLKVPYLDLFFFNIYINDLFCILKEANVCNYADDTGLHVCDKNIPEIY